MDYKIRRNSKLLDDLIGILQQYPEEKGAVLVLDHLKAVKANYNQRSLDHMLGGLILGIHDLIANPPSEELWRDLSRVIEQYNHEVSQTGARLAELARQYEASGGKLLSRDEILEEVYERRGGTR